MKPSMKPIVLFTTALMVATTGMSVLAQTGPAGKGGDRMAQLDANKDGAIDRSEAAKAPKLLEHFDRMDANKDGRISAEERPQRGRHGGRGGDRMAQLDANKDGAIDRSEAAKAPKLLEHFDRMDANKDGRISAEERPQRGRHGGRGGDRMAQLDANKDGAIDRSEAAKAPKLLEHFDRMDANKDGRISAEERPQRGRHGGRAKLDTDGDQRVSRQEAAQRPRLTEKFAAIDGNKDGYLSRDEMQAYRREHGKRPQGPAQP